MAHRLYAMGNGTRFYDPDLGQFLEKDPVYGDESEPRSLSPYAYSFNNPVWYMDPTGLAVQDPQKPVQLPTIISTDESNQAVNGEEGYLSGISFDEPYTVEEPSKRHSADTSDYRPLLKPSFPAVYRQPRYRGNDNYVAEKPTGIKWLDNLNDTLNGYLDFLEDHSYGIVSRARARGFIDGFEDAERSFLTSYVNTITHPIDTWIINPLNRIGQNYYDAYGVIANPGDFFNALYEGGQALPSQDLNYRIGYIGGEQTGNYVITTAAVGAVVTPFAGGGSTSLQLSVGDDPSEFGGTPTRVSTPGELAAYPNRVMERGNRIIEAVLKEDFEDLNFEHKSSIPGKETYSSRPFFDPQAKTGVADPNTLTSRIGPEGMENRTKLRNGIVHEELHHSWWEKKVQGRHHYDSRFPFTDQVKYNQLKFYATIARYERMRGWVYNAADIKDWSSFVKGNSLERQKIVSSVTKTR